MEYVIIASGAYLISFGFFMETTNLQSSIVFRVLPGLIGVGNMIAGLNMAGML